MLYYLDNNQSATGGVNSAVQGLGHSNNLQKSPKLLKSFIASQNVSGAAGVTATGNNSGNSKNPQKSEINHYIKKNTVAAQPSLNKFPLGHLSQAESSQSFKNSPVKHDIGLFPKQYPQSIQKSTTHKTQKIKIGMHKKAVSLMGSSSHQGAASQLTNFPNVVLGGGGGPGTLGVSNLVGEQHFLDYTKQSVSNMLGNTGSQKQSYVPSSQTSFNDYSSSHNQNYAEVKMFPKVDNFIINDKTGSLLTAQQQAQVKNFQRMLHDSQFSQQTFDQIHSVQQDNLGVKSFDQRPPIGSQTLISNNQSQRLSIVSDTVSQLQGGSSSSQNPGYRSHANSFKGSANNIAMKHPPNKYIKGQSVSDSQQNLSSYNQPGLNLPGASGVSNSLSNASTSLKSKKSLQYSHQRTLSDTHALKNSSVFNPNLTSQAQGANRNFQELIRSVNNKEQLMDAFGNPLMLQQQQAMTHDIYPIGMTSTTTSIGNTNAHNPVAGQHFAAKTTIGSSRQSAQSQVVIDERDILNYQGLTGDKLIASINGPATQGIEINQIYQGQLKDQFQKTKQALKLTQQQFGGPSRKVVQGSRLNGSANTQSYRLSSSNSNNHNNQLAGASFSKMTFQVNDPKQTPKLNLKNGGVVGVSGITAVGGIVNGKMSAATQSQNVSSHGVRSTHNQTALTSNQAVMYTDKIKKSKAGKAKMDSSAGVVGIASNLQGLSFGHMGETTMQSLQRSIGKTSSKAANLGHKRSISDGNQALFQSLSNRAPNQQQLNSYNLAVKQGGLLPSTQVHTGHPSTSQMHQQHLPQASVQSFNLSNTQSEVMRKSSYSKQQSLSKIQHQEGNHYQNLPKGSMMVGPSDYNIVSASERGSYNHSQITAINQNVAINSHRKIGSEGVVSKHMRHNSEQVPSTFMAHQNPLLNQKGGVSNANGQMTVLAQSQYMNSGQNSKNGQHGSIPKQLKGELKPIVQHSGSEMIIMDQGINQISSVVAKQNLRDLQQQNHVPISSAQMPKSSHINSSTLSGASNPSQKYPQQSITQLKPVEERIETQESAASDPSLTPRSRMTFKLNKKIRLAFQKPYTAGMAVSFQTSTEFYKIGKVMGKGAFGKVNLAIHRLSNKFVALKSINKQFLSEEASKRKVMQEFNILRRTRHASIVRLYESFETQQHIVFVMEVCGAGDLLTYVRRRRKLKEEVAKHMFKQICDGLRYCHSKNILHRDIKLDNILLTSEGDIKICDFGVSKLVKPSEIMTEQCGTPAYIAPEVFENKGYEGYASDVWSAGVVLYAMLYGTVPFKANNMTELQKQITKCQTTFKDEISNEAISLLKGILERDPSKRLKISEILKHPWMQDIPEKVSVFTEQEKEKTNSEFAYYNFKNDQSNQDNAGEIVHTDPFTEQMLNSTQNSLLKNASTKSVILAPFNSTRSHIDNEFYQRNSVQEIMADKKVVIKFSAKAKEVDRHYEGNNNAELDNGVYHQDSEEGAEDNKNEEAKKKQANGKSLETSFDKNDGAAADDDYGLNEEHGVNKPRKQSEWQKLEKMVIDRQKTEEEEEEKDYQTQQNKMNLGTAQTLVLDDRIVGEIERHGFPRAYVVNSLNNDELNYVTTHYYLLITIKEY